MKFYGIKEERNGVVVFTNIHSNKLILKMGLVCDDDDLVCEIEVEEVAEASDETYFAWRGAISDKVDYVFRFFISLDVCFDCHAKKLEAEGKGKIINLKIVSVKELGKVADL